MAAITPIYSWPYPALADPPNVPSDMSKLALAVETTMKAANDKIALNTAAVLDTGWIVGGTTVFAPFSTWLNAPLRARKIGNKVRVEAQWTRQTSDINPAANGAMVVNIGTLAVGWRPVGQNLRALFSHYASNGSISIGTDGVITTISATPGIQISIGTQIYCSFEFFIN